jgi:hypothetical protein
MLARVEGFVFVFGGDEGEIGVLRINFSVDVNMYSEKVTSYW